MRPVPTRLLWLVEAQMAHHHRHHHHHLLLLHLLRHHRHHRLPRVTRHQAIPPIRRHPGRTRQPVPLVLPLAQVLPEVRL